MMSQVIFVLDIMFIFSSQYKDIEPMVMYGNVAGFYEYIRLTLIRIEILN